MEKNENRTNIFSLLQFSCQPFSVQSPQDFLIHLWLVYLVTHAVDISPRYLPSCPALWNRWTSDLHPACWQWSCRLYYMEKHLLFSCWILRLLLVPEKKKKKKVYPACPFCDIHDSVDLLVFSLWLHLTPSLARMLQINIQEVCVTSLQSISCKILLKATRNQTLSKQWLSKSFAYTNRKWTNLVSFFLLQHHLNFSEFSSYFSLI